MVKKALARQGIAVTSAANAPIAIEATTDKIIVDGLTVKSIEDLIYLVNDTLNS